MNVETWGHVPGPVVMARALVELRCGIVARQHEIVPKYGHNFAPTLYCETKKIPIGPLIYGTPFCRER